MLNTYSTSQTSTTVAQNATPGFLRGVIETTVSDSLLSALSRWSKSKRLHDLVKLLRPSCRLFRQHYAIYQIFPAIREQNVLLLSDDPIRFRRIVGHPGNRAAIDF